MRRRYARALAAQPTYPQVGASVDGPLPPGYDHIDERTRVGAADEFGPARAALFGWALQRAAGFRVQPPHAWPVPGATVLLRRAFGPLRIAAPCRVVRVLDEPHRAGFAYGSLPGHPQRGEEAFLLDRCDGDTWLTIRGFSRPAAWYARFGAPLTRLVQRRILTTYLAALREQPCANHPVRTAEQHRPAYRGRHE